LYSGWVTWHPAGMSPTEPSASLVNEKTAFSWPVVVVLGGCLVAVGGGMVRVEGLQRDLDLLRTQVGILEHQQNADRGRIHEQGATLTEVKSILVDLRSDVREALRGGVRPATRRE
jgi:hypothetical protein